MLTEAGRKALAFIATVAPHAAYPSAIGHAMTDGFTKSGRAMKAQGLGRLGGGMGARLVKLGLAGHAGRGYVLTSAGRRALEERDDG